MKRQIECKVKWSANSNSHCSIGGMRHSEIHLNFSRKLFFFLLRLLLFTCSIQLNVTRPIRLCDERLFIVTYMQKKKVTKFTVNYRKRARKMRVLLVHAKMVWFNLAWKFHRFARKKKEKTNIELYTGKKTHAVRKTHANILAISFSLLK